MIRQRKNTGKIVTIDLHLHSQASDGELAPDDLMRFAFERGVTRAAITDHDTALGVKAARREAVRLGMKFHAGIEVSCSWGKRCIHVVGLDINEEDEALAASVRYFAAQRSTRARVMADKLLALGCPDLYAEAVALAPNKDVVSRVHFAQALMAAGVVKHQQEAFDRFLGDSAPAFVMAPWPELAKAVELIRHAGGVAVLAHPGRYRFKEDWMIEALVEDFVKAGGAGIEVVSGSQSPDFTPRCAAWAKQYHLGASTGSDFHSLKGSRPLPGGQGDIPTGLESIVDQLKD